MNKWLEIIKCNSQYLNVIDILDDCEEVPKELRQLDFENVHLNEITEDSITVIVGGDWQPGGRIKIKFNEENEPVIDSFEMLKEPDDTFKMDDVSESDYDMAIQKIEEYKEQDLRRRKARIAKDCCPLCGEKLLPFEVDNGFLGCNYCVIYTKIDDKNQRIWFKVGCEDKTHEKEQKHTEACLTEIDPLTYKPTPKPIVL